MSFFKKISFWSAVSLLLCACTDYVQKIDDRYGEWETAKCGNTLVLNEALGVTSVGMIQSSVQPILIVMRKSKGGDMLIYGLYVDSFEEISGSTDGAVYNFTGVLRDEYGNVVDDKFLDGDKIAFNFPYDQEYWYSDEYKQIQENYAANGVDELTFNSLIGWTKKLSFYVVGSSGNMISGWPKYLEDWASVSTDLNSCSTSINMGHAFKLTDLREGQTYKTVKIGSQTWMAENLNFKTDSSFCYNNEESYCAKYGRLYMWSAVTKACPSGWHLPSSTEWESLFNAVGGSSTAGSKLKSTSGWIGGNSTDAFGFSALPAGYRGYTGGFTGEGYAYFWSSSEYDSDYAYVMNLYYDDLARLYYDNKYSGFSVRCLKD